MQLNSLKVQRKLVLSYANKIQSIFPCTPENIKLSSEVWWKLFQTLNEFIAVEANFHILANRQILSQDSRKFQVELNSEKPSVPRYFVALVSRKIY